MSVIVGLMSEDALNADADAVEDDEKKRWMSGAGGSFYGRIDGYWDAM